MEKRKRRDLQDGTGRVECEPDVRVFLGLYMSKLTLRERKLIFGIAKGLDFSDAARQAGYAESTVNGHLNKIIGKRRVQEALDDIFKRIGLSDEQLAIALRAGLEATKPLPLMTVNDGSKGTYVEVPDHLMRHRYLETVLFLKGYIPYRKKISK